ncbi:MAG: YraN family protein [Bacteroidota bacterium]|nr:YraN family protein [Bacteroidota bacterium]
MAKHNETGNWGELQALAYIKEKKPSWEILYTNWKYKKSEVDIICKDGKQLVFVEVKTRTGNKFGHPEEAVGYKKKEKLAEAASAFIEEINHQGEIRFDIISITILQNKTEIYHIEDAFFPGLD